MSTAPCPRCPWHRLTFGAGMQGCTQRPCPKTFQSRRVARSSSCQPAPEAVLHEAKGLKNPHSPSHHPLPGPGLVSRFLRIADALQLLRGRQERRAQGVREGVREGVRGLRGALGAPRGALRRLFNSRLRLRGLRRLWQGLGLGPFVRSSSAATEHRVVRPPKASSETR